MVEELIGGLLVFVVAGVLVVLVRSLTRMYERLLETNGKARENPVDLQGIFEEALTEAMKKAEDRDRKRAKRGLTHLSDEEVAQALAGETIEEVDS